jgi:hypothetical protein
MTKYIVKNPAGEVIGKRSSDRIYTHAIVASFEKREHWVARMEQEAARQAREIARYEAEIAYLKNGGKLTLVNTGYSSSWFMSDLMPAKDEGGSINERRYGKSAIFGGEGLAEEQVRLMAIENLLGHIKTVSASRMNTLAKRDGYAAGPELFGEEGVVSFHMSLANANKSFGSCDFARCDFRIVEVEVAA